MSSQHSLTLDKLSSKGYFFCMSDSKINLSENLKILVENKKFSSIKEILSQMNPSDVAAVCDDLDESNLPVVFRLLPKETAADAFVEMLPDIQEILIKAFSDTELKQVISELYIDDAVDIVEEMPANVVKRILAQATPEMRKNINEILKYPEDSAGSLMTIEYLSLKPDWTVGESIDYIRKSGLNKETIYICYVTSNRKLIGWISVKDLLLAQSDEQTVANLMEENVISVNTLTDREQVAQMFSKYNFMAMPVTDSENRLVGIITFDDVMDVMEEETSEDIAIMSGTLPTDKPYLKSNPIELFLHRIPWLLFLMISATFTGMIINNFENALAANVILTAFIPMLMDTGGNSGSQSSVTIIRAISLGEIEFKDLHKVILKELLTALLCGIALAFVCFGKMYLIDRVLLRNSELTFTVAIVVSISMFVTVLIAKILGGILPILAKKLGADPAVMASPFITTCADALSLIAYFKIASCLLF